MKDAGATSPIVIDSAAVEIGGKDRRLPAGILTMSGRRPRKLCGLVHNASFNRVVLNVENGCGKVIVVSHVAVKILA